MLNFDNISDVEFEYLCKDIMESILGTTLRRFAPGKDGGIDLIDDITTKNIIVQVKHYRSSPQSNTVNSLKKEAEKVKKLNPNNYYICISRELSPENTKKVYEMFSEYMESESNILTITEINDFLEKEENIEILKKHYKLWLCSTGILEDMISNQLFIDCETLISEFSKKEKYFVKTKAFDEALKCLENNNIVFITGHPGVGKTITSEMLTMYFAAQGYTVRYTTNSSDLSDLKRSLSRDKDKREIVFIDDCFGQIYFKMRENQNKELLSLIKYINLHPNKLLLLNSRVTIYKEAQARNQELIESLHEKEYKVFVLNMSQLSLLEKAKILYNHLYFKGVPVEYLNEIRKEKRYRTIIQHINYTPRLVEKICNASVRQYIVPNKYYDFIISILDNPKDTWNNEYEDRLQQVDRLLLTTLYSLTDTYVDENILRVCFERRILGYPAIDKTINQYERSLDRLNESFISITDVQGKKRISVVNPSVNDFLKARLSEKNAESEELMQSLCHIQQMTNMLKILEYSKWGRDAVKAHKVNDFIFDNEDQKLAFIVSNISKYKICDNYYQDKVKEYLTCPKNLYLFKSIDTNISDIIVGLLTEELFLFYHIGEILEIVDFSLFFEDAYLDELIDMIVQLNDTISDVRRKDFVDTAVHYLKEAIEIFYQVDADELDLDVGQAVQNSFHQWNDGEVEFEMDFAVGQLEDEAKDILESEVKEKLVKLPGDIVIPDKVLDELYTYPSGIENLVDSYLSDNEDDLYMEESDIAITHSESSIDEIDAIFER